MILSKEPDKLAGAARAQLAILQAAGVQPVAASQAQAAIARATVLVDALIGYSLRDAPRVSGDASATGQPPWLQP